MPLKTSLVAALAGPLLLCAPAMAQTAAEAPLAANSTAALDAQIASYLDASPDAGPVKTAPALRGSDAPPPPDRAVHGEVGVGIGTGGYREFHAAMVAPRIHPPAEGHGGSGIFRAQGVAVVGAIGHGKTSTMNGNFLFNKAGARGSQGNPQGTFQ